MDYKRILNFLHSFCPFPISATLIYSPSNQNLRVVIIFLIFHSIKCWRLSLLLSIKMTKDFIIVSIGCFFSLLSVVIDPIYHSLLLLDFWSTLLSNFSSLFLFNAGFKFGIFQFSVLDFPSVSSAS